MSELWGYYFRRSRAQMSLLLCRQLLKFRDKYRSGRATRAAILNSTEDPQNTTKTAVKQRQNRHRTTSDLGTKAPSDWQRCSPILPGPRSADWPENMFVH